MILSNDLNLLGTHLFFLLGKSSLKLGWQCVPTSPYAFPLDRYDIFFTVVVHSRDPSGTNALTYSNPTFTNDDPAAASTSTVRAGSSLSSQSGGSSVGSVHSVIRTMPNGSGVHNGSMRHHNAHKSPSGRSSPFKSPSASRSPHKVIRPSTFLDFFSSPTPPSIATFTPYRLPLPLKRNWCISIGLISIGFIEFFAIDLLSLLG